MDLLNKVYDLPLIIYIAVFTTCSEKMYRNNFWFNFKKQRFIYD